MAYIPFIVEQALGRLGADIEAARRRRRISTTLMAERLGVSRPTLKRLESGEPSVSIGVLATALYMLDPDKLDQLAALLNEDLVGQSVSDRQLPKRIHGSPR